MRFASLTVRAKLMGAFGCLVGMVLLVSALALRSLGQSHDDYTRYINQTTARLTLAKDVLDAANARAIGARNLVLMSSSADREVEKAEVTKAHSKLTAAIAKLKQATGDTAAVTDSERRMLAEIEIVA